MTEVPARPSATVVLLRDTDEGPEVLLLLRSAKLTFHGGEWVFPGGRVDDEDLEGLEDKDPHGLPAALRAAQREAMEEAGVHLEPDELVPIAHWTTPVILPKRFATWFLLGAVRETVVEVDGGEIDDAMWVRPKDALAKREAGEIGLPPPTFITLCWLADFATAGDAVEAFRARTPERYFPRVCLGDDVVTNVFFGDAAFESGDVTAEGPKHRLTMRKGPWVLEREIP